MGVMSSAPPEQALCHLPDFAALDAPTHDRVIHEAMRSRRRRLDALAADPHPPTAENVIHAWELAGLPLARALAAFTTVRDADTTEELDALAERLAPELAAHEDAVALSRPLFDRLLALQDAAARGEVELDDEDSHWLSERIRDHRRQGVELPPGDQDALRALNGAIAAASARFERLARAGRNEAAVHLTDEAELAGLGPEQRRAAADAAAAAGLDGWLLELVNTTGQDWLARLDRQDVRRRVFEASVGRGASGPNATGTTVVELARLRARRAELLGFASHAALVADDGCAGTVGAVEALLGPLGERAAAAVREDAEDRRRAFARFAPGLEFGPWDWAWTTARLRAATAVDDAVLSPYLEFGRVMREGVLAAAHALYGITAVRRGDLTGYTDDCVVLEIRDADGSMLGLCLVDPWARPTKQGGAWMTDLVCAGGLTGDLPVVTLNTNVTRPAPGRPALLSWDQVITCFHEFGHCLHGLFADSRHPSMSGTNTPRDHVEFPSQVNEHWAWDRRLLARYARHHVTGEPLSAGLIDRLEAGRLVDAGFEDLEMLAATGLDQAWHTGAPDALPAGPEDVDAFEAAALEARGLALGLVPPRYRSRYFSHIWGGGYDGAYYAYTWAEVYDADACAWFAEQEVDGDGGLNRAAGERFRREVLAPGGSVDPAAAYRAFRGADPDVAHLVRRRTRGPER